MPASPFFKPSYPDTVVVEQAVATPRGRHHQKRGVKVATEGVVENKSSLLGCAANMMTCIVGSGIVGLPYAMKQTGFVAGVGLILLTAALTEKSLRLLVETAKHLHKQSYEATAEVAFGSLGFRFVLGKSSSRSGTMQLIYTHPSSHCFCNSEYVYHGLWCDGELLNDNTELRQYDSGSAR